MAAPKPSPAMVLGPTESHPVAAIETHPVEMSSLPSLISLQPSNMACTSEFGVSRFLTFFRFCNPTNEFSMTFRLTHRKLRESVLYRIFISS